MLFTSLSLIEGFKRIEAICGERTEHSCKAFVKDIRKAQLKYESQRWKTRYESLNESLAESSVEVWIRVAQFFL